MNKLNLRLQGGMGIRPKIQIDGQEMKYNRKKHEAIQIAHETDKSQVLLEISNILEINGPLWFIMQMLFFVVSVFGIFNPRLEKQCFLVSYKAKINLQEGENKVVLKFNQLAVNSPAISVINEASVEVMENNCVLDKKAKKRKKILTLSYVLSYLLALVLTIMLIVVL